MALELAVAAERVSGDDRPLILRVRDGDRTAFGTLVERHMRRAYYAALSLVGSHDDALDLSQEAFVRAFRARASLDPDRPFYPWLYQILRRLCFNFTRDTRTRRRILTQASPWLADGARARAQAVDPARRLEREELRARVGTAVEALPERLREVLVLREFEELKYREIAELLDIPIGTVMSRLYDARRALAEELGDIR
ncbi:MAG: sigma-70 family RNA polymerase sigma factor [Gemmatimonadales bacterium]|jgi:RNA polymerase sigma-70 factor (ECF subfamily)